MNRENSIGFIGLGMLGRPMVRSLIQEGYRVNIYNRTPEKGASLVSDGAVARTLPIETAEPRGMVITCVSDDHALKAVVGENAELAKRLGNGGIHISMSTILPQTAQELEGLHASFGCRYIAAPVLGRPDLVAAKKQSYLVAGDPAGKQRVIPVLEKIGAAVFDFGETPSTANAAKLSINFLIAAAIEAMAEAFAFAEKNNVAKQDLLKVIGATLFSCPIYQNYGRQIIERTYTEPLFRLALGMKDINLLAAAAADSRTPMRFLRILEDRFLSAVAHGLGNYDWTGIASEIENEAGLQDKEK